MRFVPAWFLMLTGIGCARPMTDPNRLYTTGLGQPGGRGELFNVSVADGDPKAQFDPHKPTIVITHGLNTVAGLVRFIYPALIAEAIRQRYPDTFNLAVWDWNRGAFFSPHFLRVRENAVEQGRMLARALRQRGVGREVHLIGHSLGGLIITSAARELGGVDQLTFLDSIINPQGMVFGRLPMTKYARRVENYWAPLPAGFGKAVPVAGVYNRQVTEVPLTQGVSFFIAPIRGHVNVMLWYLDTVRATSLPDGFNRSVFVQRIAANNSGRP